MDICGESRYFVVMPHATPLLRSLRQKTGVKPGPWADAVEYDRSQYSHVESGRRSAGSELYGRCARLLAEHLGIDVEPGDLMAADPEGEEEEHEHTDAGTGPPNRGDSTGPGRVHPGMRAAS